MAKKEKKPEIKIERVYNVPLRKEWLKAPKYKRAKKAVTALKQFLARHMKADLEDIKIGKYANQEIWKQGMRNPPHHIKITAKKDEKGIVTAELEGAPAEEKEMPKKIVKKEKIEEEVKTKKEETREEKKTEAKVKEEEKPKEIIEEKKEVKKEKIEKKAKLEEVKKEEVKAEEKKPLEEKKAKSEEEKPKPVKKEIVKEIKKETPVKKE